MSENKGKTDAYGEHEKVAVTRLSKRKTSIILVVTRHGHLAEPVMEHIVKVAERLRYRLLVAFVDTLPLFWDGGRRRRRFSSALQECAAVFGQKAAARGVGFDYVQESGKISKVISRICHVAKKIEFVVIDKGIKVEEAAARAPVPVFKVFSGNCEPGTSVTDKLYPPDIILDRVVISKGRKSEKMNSTAHHGSRIFMWENGYDTEK